MLAKHNMSIYGGINEIISIVKINTGLNRYKVHDHFQFNRLMVFKTKHNTFFSI